MSDNALIKNKKLNFRAILKTALRAENQLILTVITIIFQFAK